MTWSTAQVVQVAGAAARVVSGLTPIFPCTLSGPVAVCCCRPGDNLELHWAIAATTPGSVIVCEAGGRKDVGYFGDLMALECQRRAIAGLVIDGAVRDSHSIQRMGFPVFCSARCPLPPTKRYRDRPRDAVSICGVRLAEGDMLTADCDGIVVVPAAEWAGVAAKAAELEGREREIRQRLQKGERLSSILGLNDRHSQ
jgi:4-hydroxy-4-methyl-2-oxoglutarate aldolase